jgi:hypothetical protein
VFGVLAKVAIGIGLLLWFIGRHCLPMSARSNQVTVFRLADEHPTDEQLPESWSFAPTAAAFATADALEDRAREGADNPDTTGIVLDCCGGHRFIDSRRGEGARSSSLRTKPA